MDATFLSRLLQILKNATKLLIRQPHHRIKGCTTYGKDGKETPAFHTLGDQELLDIVKFRIIATIDAGDDIKHKALSGNKHIECLTHHLETLVVATHPVMVFLQSIEADGHRTDASLEQAFPALGRQMKGIGDHTPGEAHFIDSPSTLLKIASHQGLTTRDDDKHLVGISLLGNAVEYS